MLTPLVSHRSGRVHLQTRIVIAVAAVFFLGDFLDSQIRALSGYRELPRVLRWMIQPVLWFALCGIAWRFFNRVSFSGLIRDFGLAAPVGPALRLGLLVTAPMWLGSLAMDRPLAFKSSIELLFLAAIWPLGEEILFRGFAFGLLHQRAGWNLWIAAMVTGATFGVGHLLNASIRHMPLAEQAGTIAIIGVGGILFAWAYARWGFNLWVPWSIHAFMNFWWEIFALSDDPLGGWVANAMRLAVVALAVGLTLCRHRLPISWGLPQTGRAPQE